MRRLSLAIALLAATGCAAILGIEDTVDDAASDAGLPGRDVDASATPPDASAVDGDAEAPPRGGPSCAGLANDCAGTHSCCESILVDGGSFLRSYDGVPGGGFTDAGYPASVASFRLDRFETTVGRFRKFVAAGMGTQQGAPAPDAGVNPNLAGSGWSSTFVPLLPANPAALSSALQCPNGAWTDSPDAGETMPMTCLTWALAFAFCVWDGGRLPTEAEWNYAASAGAEQRSYPWSAPPMARTIDATYAVYDGLTHVAVVGSKSPKGDGAMGLADVAGNAWEWTLDVYADPYPTKSCVDCANLGTDVFRVARGGAYGYFAAQALTSYRFRVDGTGKYGDLGVRCARAP
jgi:sulfatase modifying factor 1